MEKIFKKTSVLSDNILHYCPGCSHGIIHRLVTESIEELGIQNRTIAIAPVGCAVYSYDYFETDIYVAAHGRAPAVATGAKRADPSKIVFTYQGDGDPLPSFEGEPKLVELDGDIDAFTQKIWSSLNEDNKVSLFVRYIEIESGKYETRIVNKNQ